MILENTLAVQIVTKWTTDMATLGTNFVILLSYPLNFFVYCAMSRKFRQAFCDLLRLPNTRPRRPSDAEAAGDAAPGGGRACDRWRSSAVSRSTAVTAGERQQSTVALQNLLVVTQLSGEQTTTPPPRLHGRLLPLTSTV